MLHDRDRAETWAFEADEVLGVQRVPRSQLRGVPSTLVNPAVGFSQAVLSWNGRSIGLLDEQRVFTALRSLGTLSSDLSGFSMMELFRMEAESHTATLSAGLVALEGASASPEVIEPLMRAAHSLKGAARIVGLDAAVRVAHAMEDCFVAAQKGKLVLRSGARRHPAPGRGLLVQVAQLGDAELEPWQSEHADSIDALVADLTAVKEGQAAACTSEPMLPSSRTPPPPPHRPEVDCERPGPGRVGGRPDPRRVIGSRAGTAPGEATAEPRAGRPRTRSGTRPGRAGDGRELDPVDGPGGRGAGADSPAPAAGRRALAAQGTADGTAGNAAKPGRPAVEPARRA